MNDDRKVPAALVLPEGKFFFGYKYVPFDKTKVKKKEEAGPAPTQSFQGEGNSLRRNNGASSSSAPAPASQAPETETEEKKDPWANLGSGQTLSGRAPKRAAASPPAPEPTRAPSPPKQHKEQDDIDATMMDESDFMFDDTAYSDDEDVIEIDSD